MVVSHSGIRFPGVHAALELRDGTQDQKKPDGEPGKAEMVEQLLSRSWRQVCASLQLRNHGNLQREVRVRCCRSQDSCAVIREMHVLGPEDASSGARQWPK